jgi:hypothetical protein
MAAVYSHSFFSAAGVTGSPTFSVPNGYVGIVRDVDVFWGSQLVPPSGRVLGAAGQAFAIWQGAIAAPNIMSWRGRHVAVGPCDLTVSVDVGDADVSVSGYLLVNDGP